MKKITYQVKKVAGVFLFTLTFTLASNVKASTLNVVSETVNSELPYPKTQFQNNLGTFSTSFKSLKVLKSDFESNLNKYFGLNDKNTFKLVRELNGEQGTVFYTYQHFFNDVAVEGDLVFVQTKNDVVQIVSGQLVSVQDLNTSTSLSDDKIKEIAYNNLGTNENVTESEMEQLIIKQDLGENVKLSMVKKITLFSAMPNKIVTFYIDAQTGDLISSFDKIYHADTASTSATLYRGNQNMTVDSYNGSYRLKDNARNIHTRNGSGWNGGVNSSTGELTGTISEYTNASANFTSTSLKPVVEVHWGMSKTYDYYKNIHNRNSYDGKGAIIRNYYNAPTTIFPADNAAAYDSGTVVAMLYGAGSQYFSPVVSLDVAGHEFSHLVVSRNGNGGLNYLNEAGALNESFADMFGTAIEFYVNQSPNWTVGEGLWKISQVTPNYLRSLSDPNSAPAITGSEQPDTYKGTYWHDYVKTPNYDSGGVHVNSGVGNFWFYLLSEGGSGINDIKNSYYVSGITIQKAEKIIYLALTTGLTPTATYLDAYNATKNAAETLYGVNSNEWKQVVNAWYAVGIGNAPAATQNIEMQSKLNIYPNPANETVYIDSSLEEDTTVEVYDLSGKRVLNPINVEFKTTVNVSNLSTGMYILKFKSNSGEYSHKLMIN